MSAGAIVAICVAVTGLFVGTAFSLLMIEELDRRKQDSLLDSKFMFTRRATLRTFREYRNSCPNGKLHRYALAGYAFAIAGLIFFAASMVRVYQPLAVRITSPADGAIFTAPVDLIISAEASEGNLRRISRVDFYQGVTFLGSSTTPPYSVTWGDVPNGSYSLTARATDERGTTSTSNAVSISVNTFGNTP
jgi:hypothetical protein